MARFVLFFVSLNFLYFDIINFNKIVKIQNTGVGPLSVTRFCYYSIVQRGTRKRDVYFVERFVAFLKTYSFFFPGMSQFRSKISVRSMGTETSAFCF